MSSSAAFFAALSEILVAIQIPMLILDGGITPPKNLKELGLGSNFGSLEFFIISVSLALFFRTVTLASNIISGMFLGHVLFKNSHHRMKLRSNSHKHLTEKEAPISLLQIKNHAVVNNLIIPLITILSNSLIAISFLAFLIFFDGLEVVLFGLLIATLYLLIMFGVNSYVKKFATQFYFFVDIFISGIKNFYSNLFEVHNFKLDDYFSKKLEEQDIAIRKYHSFIQVIEQFPKILVDLVVFIVIGWIAFSFHNESADNFGLEIIILSIYSAMRLLPILNGIYANLMKVSRASPAAKELLYLNNAELMAQPELEFNKIYRIEARNLEKRIGKKIIFSNLSFAAVTGEVVGIVGRSGSGKSTLAKTLLGAEDLSCGSLVFNDKYVLNTYDNYSILEKLIYVRQTPIIFEGDLDTNLGMVEGVNQDVVKEHLESLGIEEIYNFKNKHQLTNLSVGMQQRLCLVRAFFSKADVLILDEITSALDHESEKLAIKYISKYFNDRIVFLISHRKEPLKICNRVISL